MFLEILYLFVFTSFFGWLIEFFYRGITYKKAYKPGFLNGFYLPIYGVSSIILYFISSYNINVFYKFLLFIIIITLVEYITGWIFVNVFKIHLWNYSDDKFNFQGIICLGYSIIWGFLGLFFNYIIYPVYNNIFYLIKDNIFIFILIIIFYLIFILDLIVSFNLLYKIKKMRNELRYNILAFNYPLFRQKIRKNIKFKLFNNYFKIKPKIDKDNLLKSFKKILKE